MPTFERAPTARAEILIRTSAKDAFAAFVEPMILTKFWLARASAPLAVGARVKWDFMVPGASDEIEVTELEANQRIVIKWSNGSTTKWTFTPTGESPEATA